MFDKTLAKEALTTGTKVGEMEGFRETKYMGWVVFKHPTNNRMFAFVTEPDGFIIDDCGEEVTGETLSQYID